MYGNSAPLLNRKMSRKLHGLTQIIGVKPPNAAVKENASPPPAGGGKTLARSVWKPADEDASKIKKAPLNLYQIHDFF
jgi:hypothetical protein